MCLLDINRWNFQISNFSLSAFSFLAFSTSSSSLSFLEIISTSTYFFMRPPKYIRAIMRIKNPTAITVLTIESYRESASPTKKVWAR
jgi:hypothetical protein